MNQYLPYANFKWVKDFNKIEQKLMNKKVIVLLDIYWKYI